MIARLARYVSRFASADFTTVLQILVSAVFAEALLLRFLLRLGPLAPPTREVEQIAAVGLFVGLAALNLAYLLTLATLAWLAWRAPSRVWGACVFIALGIGVALDTSFAPASFAFVFHLLVLGTCVWALARTHWRGAARLGLGLMLTAYAFATYAILTNALTIGGISLLPFNRAAAFAEFCAVLAVIPIFIAFRNVGNGKSLLIPSASAALVSILWFGVSSFAAWLPPLLTIWNFSFTLFLPSWIYAFALGLYVYVIVHSIRNGHVNLAIGLLLIAFGGLRPDFAYMQRLVWLGFLLVCLTNVTKVVEDARCSGDNTTAT